MTWSQNMICVRSYLCRRLIRNGRSHRSPRRLPAKPEKTKLVMIAGPSSSGKTTFFAQALHSASDAGNETASDCSGQLFCGSGKKTPRDEDDNYNFECLEAIDIEQFNKDMQALLAGEAVHLPIFDFKKGSRSYDTTPTQHEGTGYSCDRRNSLFESGAFPSAFIRPEF